MSVGCAPRFPCRGVRLSVPSCLWRDALSDFAVRQVTVLSGVEGLTAPSLSKGKGHPYESVLIYLNRLATIFTQFRLRQQSVGLLGAGEDFFH